MSETTELRTEERPIIQTGPEPAADEGRDPQADIRNAFAERFEAQRLQEVTEGRERMGLPPEEETPEAEAEAPAAAEEAAPEAPVADLAPHQPAPSPAAPAAPRAAQPPQLFPVALPDGRVQWATAEQIQQLASLGMQAIAQPQQQVRQPDPAPVPAATHPASFDGEAAKAIAQRLTYGAPDEQAQALVDLVQAAQQQPVDPQAIRQQAVQEALQHIRLEQNLNTIGGEFPEIFNNRVLTQLAALQLNELRSNPRNAGYADLDLYREACRSVRQAVSPPTQQLQPGNQPPPVALQAAPPAASNARVERKRAAPSIPVATDRRLAMADDTPREKTPSEIVADMRQARHQVAIS